MNTFTNNLYRTNYRVPKYRIRVCMYLIYTLYLNNGHTYIYSYFRKINLLAPQFYMHAKF